MIIRIVKLHISTDKTQDFLDVFEQNKTQIRGFEGCMHLELLFDINHPDTVFTYSIWQNEEAIENYRNSELFNGIWNTVKPMFCGKPEAWSTLSKFKA
jgi:heme oxygenase (mycobilin-producing)